MAIATERVWTRDEMWEGVLVMPPLANNEHQRIVSKLTSAFSSVIDWDAGEQALPSANVSDRDAGWTYNYRDPDCNPAHDCGTHWHGGPDMLVEVISPGENPLAELPDPSRLPRPSRRPRTPAWPRASTGPGRASRSGRGCRRRATPGSARPSTCRP